MIKVDRVYEIRLPAEVRGLLQQLTFIISLGLEGVPLTCLGAKGYVQRLLLWMLLPWVAVLVLVIAVVAQLQVVQAHLDDKTPAIQHARFSQNEEIGRPQGHILVQAIQRVTPMVLNLLPGLPDRHQRCV